MSLHQLHLINHKSPSLPCDYASQVEAEESSEHRGGERRWGWKLIIRIITYWENFSLHAFENTTQNFFQPTSLTIGEGMVDCSCCYTIRRDVSLSCVFTSFRSTLHRSLFLRSPTVIYPSWPSSSCAGFWADCRSSIYLLSLLGSSCLFLLSRMKLWRIHLRTRDSRCKAGCRLAAWKTHGAATGYRRECVSCIRKIKGREKKYINQGMQTSESGESVHFKQPISFLFND